MDTDDYSPSSEDVIEAIRALDIAAIATIQSLMENPETAARALEIYGSIGNGIFARASNDYESTLLLTAKQLQPRFGQYKELSPAHKAFHRQIPG